MGSGGGRRKCGVSMLVTDGRGRVVEDDKGAEGHHISQSSGKQ